MGTWSVSSSAYTYHFTSNPSFLKKIVREGRKKSILLGDCQHGSSHSIRIDRHMVIWESSWAELGVKWELYLEGTGIRISRHMVQDIFEQNNRQQHVCYAFMAGVLYNFYVISLMWWSECTLSNPNPKSWHSHTQMLTGRAKAKVGGLTDTFQATPWLKRFSCMYFKWC